MMTKFLQSLVLGLFAVFVLLVSDTLNLPSWVLFMGLTISAVYCQSIKSIAVLSFETCSGIVLGFFMAYGMTIFERTYGDVYRLLPPFMMVMVLYWVTTLKRFNNLIAYFFGLVVWFGHQSLESQAILLLSLSMLTGLIMGFFYFLISGLVTKYF